MTNLLVLEANITMFMVEKNHEPITKTVYFDNKSLQLVDGEAYKLSISRSAMIRILINKYCTDNLEVLS